MKLVKKVGVKRAQGYLYYIDKKGNICRTRMAQTGRPKKTELVIRTDIKRVKGFLYFINKEGDIYCTLLNSKGAPKKEKKQIIKPQKKYVLYKAKKQLRVKKIRLAGITKNIIIPSPSIEKGKFGIRIHYEHRKAKRYTPASKFIRLKRGAVKIRISDDIPKMYK